MTNIGVAMYSVVSLLETVFPSVSNPLALVLRQLDSLS